MTHPRDEDERTLRIHRFLPLSRANGPGPRAVIWTQGCSLRCPGCFNPETHPFDGGHRVHADRLFERIRRLGRSIEGLSISGGEPLEQIPPLTALLERIRAETSLSVLLFTGFEWNQATARPGADRLLACLDLVIAGPYLASKRRARGLVGSSNQTVHCLTDRYTAADLHTVPEAEIIITPEGDILSSGIDPPRR